MKLPDAILAAVTCNPRPSLDPELLKDIATFRGEPTSLEECLPIVMDLAQAGHMEFYATDFNGNACVGWDVKKPGAQWAMRAMKEASEATAQPAIGPFDFSTAAGRRRIAAAAAIALQCSARLGPRSRTEDTSEAGKRFSAACHKLVRLFEAIPAAPAGTCVECGCTEDKACAGGCLWANAQENVCTNCVSMYAMIGGLNP